MSKLEQRIIEEFTSHKINFEIQKPVPLDKYPWQTKRSKTSPKCDIYLNDFDVYIEVKGFMTFQAVSKLSWLSRQNFKYFIFQGTESEWNPTLKSHLKSIDNQMNISESKKIEINIRHQINELINLNGNTDFLNQISQISLFRLKDYINTKILEYESWNSQWY